MPNYPNPRDDRFFDDRYNDDRSRSGGYADSQDRDGYGRFTGYSGGYENGGRHYDDDDREQRFSSPSRGGRYEDREYRGYGRQEDWRDERNRGESRHSSSSANQNWRRSNRDDDDDDLFGGYEGRSRTGNYASEMRSRDSQGRFIGYSGHGDYSRVSNPRSDGDGDEGGWDRPEYGDRSAYQTRRWNSQRSNYDDRNYRDGDESSFRDRESRRDFRRYNYREE